MNITVLGAGAWGTALAIHLARAGNRVTLCPRRVEQALELATTRENRDYLPGRHLEASIQLGVEYFPALMEAEVAVLACPSAGVAALGEKLLPELPRLPNLRMLVTLCKGLDPGSRRTAWQVMAESCTVPVAVLSGPSHADEVAQGLPTALVLGCEPAYDSICGEVQSAMSGESMRIYLSHDPLGVALGGCLKNIYALGAGICEGLELGDNARAAYLTRALAEMDRVQQHLGGGREAVFGLSGFGDLIATCYGPWSRNRTMGFELAQGKTVEAILENRKSVVEGYAAVQHFKEMLAGSGLETPLLNQIFAILYEGVSPRRAMASLMARGLKRES